MSSSARPRTVEGAPLLTIVIPFFNEADNVETHLGELRATVGALDLTAEIIAQTHHRAVDGRVVRILDPIQRGEATSVTAAPDREERP